MDCLEWCSGHSAWCLLRPWAIFWDCAQSGSEAVYNSPSLDAYFGEYRADLQPLLGSPVEILFAVGRRCGDVLVLLMPREVALAEVLETLRLAEGVLERLLLHRAVAGLGGARRPAPLPPRTPPGSRHDETKLVGGRKEDRGRETHAGT